MPSSDAQPPRDRPNDEAAPPERNSDGPVMPERTSDETDVGWGDDEPFAADDVRRLLDDVPPHHLDRD